MFKKFVPASLSLCEDYDGVASNQNHIIIGFSDASDGNMTWYIEKWFAFRSYYVKDMIYVHCNAELEEEEEEEVAFWNMIWYNINMWREKRNCAHEWRSSCSGTTHADNSDGSLQLVNDDSHSSGLKVYAISFYSNERWEVFLPRVLMKCLIE